MGAEIQRPALAEALAVLIGAPIGLLVTIDWSRGIHHYRPPQKATQLVPWLHATPAEAVESLATARLWPWEPGDAAAPRWWCDRCEGDGAARLTLADGRRIRPLFRAPCRDCDAIGYTADPPTLPALVVVASLGAPSLVTAAELAGVLAPGAVVVWRVMTREAIKEHHRRHSIGWNPSHAASVLMVFSREVSPPTSNDPRTIRPRWPEVCPYGGAFGEPDSDEHGVHRLWPALRALAALGVHLVALDTSRIVLAVEAIGGDRG